MTDILDEIKLVIPGNRRLSPTGWTNINCPACNDRRYRGGFMFTPSGGFRYYCFNGGCNFNLHPTGWEPGEGFGGRPRKLFETLGGDTRKIPLKEIMKWNNKRYGSGGEVEGVEKDAEVSWQFPTVSMPKDTSLLLDVAQSNTAANKVMQYAAKERRLGYLVKELPLMWSPAHPYYMLIPFIHYNNKIVGYLGRHIYRNTGMKRFIQKAPKDYVFNQHLISSYPSKYLFVVESPLDALILGCVAVRNDRMTERQINLLKVSGKEIVLIPDRKKGEWEGFFQIAKDNNWFISVPKWPGYEKVHRASDIAECARKNGRLYTIETLMDAATRNLHKAKEMIVLQQT